MQGTILVVESSRTVRKMFEISLQCHPFKLEFVGDGAAALQAVQSLSPQLVFIDPNIPGMNGYDVAAQIQGIPVIAVAGKNQPPLDMARARQSHISGHIVKPFMTQKLVEVVYKAFNLPVPDAALFRTSILDIPLAKKPDDASKAASAPAPAPAPAPAAPAPKAPAPVAPAAPAARPVMPSLPGKGAPIAPLRGTPRPTGASPVMPAAPAALRPPLPSIPMRQGTTATASTPAESARPVSIAPAERPVSIAPAAPARPVSVAPAAPAAPVAPVTPTIPAGVSPTIQKLAPQVGQVIAAAASAMPANATSEMLERIAWEVIPKLAEAMLKEEISRIVRERLA